MNQYGTPLRYPGGKQRLTPFITQILKLNHLTNGHYAEPYAGGSGVAIRLLLTGQVEHIHLNDSSPAVYAFWRAIQRHSEEFCDRIAGASLTVDEWRRQRQILFYSRSSSQMDLGFSLFYLNRCNRSGIPNGGVIGGMDQKGPWKMDARFPRNELIRRVEAIAARKDQITVTNNDAEKFICSKIPSLPRKTLVYCDPPYFHQSHRLYLAYYTRADHIRLAKTIQNQLKRPWLVSYDDVSEIRRCYRARRSFILEVQYNAARVYKGKEVFFIADNLTLPKTADSAHALLVRSSRTRKSPRREALE